MRLTHAMAVWPHHGPTGDDRVVVSVRDDGLLAVLADGATGSGRGRLAAEEVVETLPRLVTRNGSAPTGTALAIAVSDVDARVARAHGGRSDATALVVHVGPGGIAGACAGDSRAVLFEKGGACRDLTAGARRRPRVGSGAHATAFAAAPVDGILLMGSDGLFEGLATADLEDAIRQAADPADAVARIGRAIREGRGFDDDASAIVIMIERGA